MVTVRSPSKDGAMLYMKSRKTSPLHSFVPHIWDSMSIAEVRTCLLLCDLNGFIMKCVYPQVQVPLGWWFGLVLGFEPGVSERNLWRGILFILFGHHTFSRVSAHSLKRMMPEETGEGTARFVSVSGRGFP